MPLCCFVALSGSWRWLISYSWPLSALFVAMTTWDNCSGCFY